MSDNNLIFNSLKKGDKITIVYDDSIAKNQTKNLVVKNRTRVGVGKSWESDKITLVNVNNPNGVKYFFYKRTESGRLSYAVGDMAIWDVKITQENNIMAKGGGISKRTTYVPNRDIKSLMLVLKGELKSVKGNDVVDGVYLKTGRNKVTKSSVTDINSILLSLKKLQKQSQWDADLGLGASEIQELIDAGFDAKDIEIIYGGYKAPVVNADTEFGSTTNGLIQSTADYQKRGAKRIAEYGKLGMFELGLKYPSFDWKEIVSQYKIKPTPKIKIVTIGRYQYKYEIYLGNGIAIGHSIGNKRDDDKEWQDEGNNIGVLNLNKKNAYQKARNYQAGFNGGYFGIVTKNKKDIYNIIDTLLKQKSGYVKDMEVFFNGLGGIGVTDVNDLKFKKGGNMAKAGKTKKRKDPPIVRGYFEDEPYEYGKGGNMKTGFKKGDRVYSYTTSNGKKIKTKGTFIKKLSYDKAVVNWDGIGEAEGNIKWLIKEEKMAKGGKTKSKQDPPIVRSYFEDEAIDYGQGGLTTGFNYSIGGL